MESEPSYEALKELGNQCFKAGDPKQAIEYFTRAIALQPNEVMDTTYSSGFLIPYARSSTRIEVYVTVLSSNGRGALQMQIRRCN